MSPRPYFLSACLLLASGAAAAVDITVTRIDDPAPDGCLAADCSLREAVQLANALAGADRILLPASPVAYQLTQPLANEDGAASGDLDVTGDLEIAGAGAGQSVVAQGAADRVLHALPGARLTLRALTLTGGRLVALGGAVYVPAGQLTLASSVLQNNSALDRGGAVYFRSSGAAVIGLDVATSQFLNNAAPRGGAVHVAGQAGTATRARFDFVEFLGNDATQSGGAIALEADLGAGSEVDVRRASFVENEVTATDGAGGAIANEAVATAQVLVRDSGFFGNRATGTASRGGALLDVQRVERSRFSQNRAARGGALQGDRADASDSEFCDNLALRNGGALSVREAYVHASTFCRNEVSGSAIGDGGGAIHVEDLAAALHVSRSTFDANVALLGGAILQRDGDLTLTQSTLAEPDGGGGSGSLLRYEGLDDGDDIVFVGNLLRGTCDFPEGDAVVDGARWNLLAPGNTCGFASGQDGFAGNLVFAAVASLPLQPLGNNGGPTPTRLPGEEGVHPAVDHVPLAECLYPLDQRGYQRNDGGCDAGAVEVGGVAVVSGAIFADGFEG